MSIVRNASMTRHETQLHRLLTEIADDHVLSSLVYFKGGTCARMLGYLDRFSVDLDFDLNPDADKRACRERVHNLCSVLGFDIKDESKKALQFFLRYEAPDHERNTVKLEILDTMFRENKYEPKHIPAIERTLMCQTRETLFANKLVAPVDRFETGQSIAGRDIYDIHHFFVQGYAYRKEVIEERRGKPARIYLGELRSFIDRHVTQKTIREDLNVLLDLEKLKRIEKHLKQEVLHFLDKEIA